MSKRSLTRGKRRRRSRPVPGSQPGLLVADPDAPQPKMRVMAYSPDGLVERDLSDPGQISEFHLKADVTWVDVQGLGDAQLIEKIGAKFGLHRLWLEDVLNTNQRPKVESHGDYRYVVVRAIGPDGIFDTEQVSIILGPRLVITFQERYGDGFDPLRLRIRNGKGNLRSHGPGYLTYALLDAVVDHYFPLLERAGERLEELEEQAIEDPAVSCLADIHTLRRELFALRRAIWPLRESLQHLLRDSDHAFSAETRVYLADCYDHTVQIMDLVESYREIASGLIDIYLSSTSHRMNEIMKVLTVISTIFIPLTFVAGVYGMNFNPNAGPLSMPELSWPLGYAACLGFMALIGIALTAYFWRRGWIFGPSSPRAKDVLPHAQQHAAPTATPTTPPTTPPTSTPVP